MTVQEFIDMLSEMPKDKLIVFRESLDDTGEYDTVRVFVEWDEVVVDIS